MSFLCEFTKCGCYQLCVWEAVKHMEKKFSKILWLEFGEKQGAHLYFVGCTSGLEANSVCDELVVV